MCVVYDMISKYDTHSFILFEFETETHTSVLNYTLV